MTIDPLHLERVAVLCTSANGVQPLRQVSAIEDGYMKNRSQIWRLSVDRARRFHAVGLILFDHRPGQGIFGSGSVRTKSHVMPTAIGRAYVELCKEACRLSNLSWQLTPYGDGMNTGYVTWQAEWKERRERFTEVLLSLSPPEVPA